MIRALQIVCAAALSATVAQAAVEGTTGRVFVDVRGTLYMIGGVTIDAIVRADGIDWELDFDGDRQLERTARELQGSEVRASGALNVRPCAERGLRHVIRVTGLRPSQVAFNTSYTSEPVVDERPLEVCVPQTLQPVITRYRDTTVDTDVYEPRGVIPERVIDRPLDWWEPSETLDAPFRGPTHESILPQIEIDW